MYNSNSNIFSGGMLLKGGTKISADLSIREERLCSTCKNYKGNLNCRVLGKIKNPDTVIHCSFYKDKKVKLNNVRSYRSLK